MINSTFRNGLKSAAELAANRPHGDRIRYRAGCKCVPCRAANSNYETTRAAARRRGESNGLVDANEVRKHLKKLSRRGIGRDTVAEITGISSTTIDLYRRGQRTQLRAMRAKAILSISLDTVANDAMLVPAAKTWEKIRWMLREGFTKSEIARRLGSKATVPALQLNKSQITAKNAMRVEKLYNILRAGDPDFESKDTFEKFLGGSNGR